MSAQRYSGAFEQTRMRLGVCPECGEPGEVHSSDNRFWVPRRCALTPKGVFDRIAQYLSDVEVDKRLTPPEKCPNCGERDYEWDVSVRAGAHAPGHNLMGLHDVEAVASLGCLTCSETLLIVVDYEIAAVMNENLKTRMEAR